MASKFLIVISLLIALICLPIGLSNNTSYAHGHGRGHKQHGCPQCEHYICEGDCSKCDECLARQRAAKEAAEKCENCGHVDCPSDCDKCADCLNERIKKLEKELQKQKD
jgi:hypothetical protein